MEYFVHLTDKFRKTEQFYDRLIFFIFCGPLKNLFPAYLEESVVPPPSR